MSINAGAAASTTVGSPGGAGPSGAGEFRRGDRREGPGEGVRVRARRGDLGFGRSSAGGASSDWEEGRSPIS